MTPLLPLDLAEVMFEELQRSRRPPDGLLHASSHITGSLRHAMLDVANAPKIENEFISEMPLLIGNLIHSWLHNTLRTLGVHYSAEVNVGPGLPPGWGGTADAVFWNPDLKRHVLVDFKTQKGEGMRYIERGGAKAEHQAQASAYYYALKNMGYNMADKLAVFYIPKNETRSRDDIVVPMFVDFEPLPEAQLWTGMLERTGMTNNYLDSLPPNNPHTLAPEDYITDRLAPVQEREQRIFYEKGSGTWTVKLMPHWSAAYCPYDTELCDCSDQGQTKIGEFDVDGQTYVPRKGYEDISPTVFPAMLEVT